MYTFIVGPWLPTSSAISVGLIHKPVRKWNTHIENVHCTIFHNYTILCEISKQHLQNRLCKFHLVAFTNRLWGETSPGEHFGYEHPARPAKGTAASGITIRTLTSQCSSSVRYRNLLVKYNHIKAMLLVIKQFKCASICLVIMSYKHI